MKRVITLGVVVVAVAMMFCVKAGTMTVTDVTAQQRYPWNGKVDIAVTFSGTSNDVEQAECIFAATNSATHAALGVSHITRVDGVSGGGSVWTRRFVWDAAADVGEAKIDDVVFAVAVVIPVEGGVQLWEDGPYWGECNIGAVEPEEYGYYFWWGDTVGCKRNATDNGWVSAKDGATTIDFDSDQPLVNSTICKDNATLRSEGWIDESGNLVAAHDAATAYLGAPWRMPTEADFIDLISKCDFTWTTRNGVCGKLVTGREAYSSKSIFLPAAGGDGRRFYYYSRDNYGSYWSSTPISNLGVTPVSVLGDDTAARYLYFTSGGGAATNFRDGYRNSGLPVRPLRESGITSVPGAVIATHLTLDCCVGSRIAKATERIFFSPAWEMAMDGGVATVKLDDVVVTNSVTAGVFEWTPSLDGTYEFTHVASVDDEPVGELLYATFVVEGVSNPITPIVMPESGQTFESSLSVSMSCPSEGATIRYTTDGSEPTLESQIYKKFKIYEKTTVKARAFFANGNGSNTAVAEYAPGRCADPVVSPRDGTVFKHSGQVVRIDQDGEEGVLRYTIDGTEPTVESPIYEGPFTVDDSTVVKAKVFSDRYFDSAVVTVNLTREWETVATPVITAAEEFTGSEAKVVIACATPEATIRYTTDGSEPTSGSPLYVGPFWVDESCIVKAVAMCEDYLMSKGASKTITKVWGIGDTMGAPDHAFATSGDAGFIRVEDATAPKGEAMRSGEIGNSAGYDLYSRSVLSTTVHGPCTLKFKWRCSCEEDDGFEWDHAEFAVDGEVKARINGIMDGWAEFTQVITEGGAHAVTWTYLKDSSEWDGDDCLWVADYSWTPTELYTHETSVPVPYDWILTYLPHTAYEYDHFEAAVRETAANGVNTVEEAYVAGLDPSDPKDKFIAKIEMVDGKSVVTWTPDLNEEGTKSVRTYKTWGKDSLDADEWLEVTPENHDDMRFFKVTVGMP